MKGVKGRLAAMCLAPALLLGLCAPAQATITRSGTLHAVVADDFRSGESTTHYTLQSGKQRTVVRPTELAAEAGDRVVVSGRMDDGRLVGTVEATSPSTQAVAPGPRKTAVVLITFPGESAPWSAQESRSEVFTGANSVNAFYEEESYGEISLTGKLNADGDVFGWLGINSPTAGCPYETWRNAANAAAAGAGIDLTGYQHIIYAFSWQSSCSWFGVAGLGSNWAMINGNILGRRAQVTTHELGHDLGLLHAGSWTCTAGGVRVQVSDECTVTQYGDPFDVMGNIATRHSNGWNLAKLGFIGPGNVRTIETTGTYAMRSALHPTVEPTTLRIPRTKFPNGSVDSWYYLEVREKGGVFENVSDASMSGVSIRATEDVSPETLLLDANPSTSTFQDAPLGVGQTFNGGSARITTLSAGGGSATVSIELDEEPPSAPTNLTATGGIERAELHWDASSDEFGVARYRVFRDGDEIDTTPGTDFTDVPAPAGDHEYVVYAEDPTGNLSAASEPATATIEADEEPPTAPANLTATVEDGGVQLEWDPSTDNVGVAHYRSFRDGFETGSTNAATEISDPFASGGAHTYVVYAEDEAGNLSDGSSPVTVTVPAVVGPICAAGSCEVTYRYSGSEATWAVPAGVSEAEFKAQGARGGGFGFNGGAYVAATIGSLTTGEAFTVSVGGKGKPYTAGGAGGYNGGGDGGLGGGGGGFSSVTRGPTLMLLASGGGGEGADGFNAIAATSVGGGSGGQGGKFGLAGKAGGRATGVHGATLGGGGGGEEGGDETAPGSGGSGGAVTETSTCPGDASAGVTGATGDSLAGGGGVAAAGGGGGGGYVGGGQGGGGATDACGNSAAAGGGGGGTSYAAPGLSPVFNGGVRLNDGQVQVAYSNPVSAAARNYFTNRDQGLEVDAPAGVLSGASGPSGVPLSASLVSPPAHGFLGSLGLGDDGSFTYTPEAGYAGVDSFTYRVADPAGNYATAQVSLRVAAPPTASITAPLAGGTYATGQSVPTGFSCAEGAGGTGLLSCNDLGGVKTAKGGVGILDTSTPGAHTYTVTAVSKDGLTGTASIAYTVALPRPEPELPPTPPGDPPDAPEGPKLPRVHLSLGVETKSLGELVRRGKLALSVGVDRAARVALSGSARLGTLRTRPVELFHDKTLSFSRPGKREVTLVLSRRRRGALRDLDKLRLSIAASAADVAAGETERTVALTLR